jgi:tetratricopeptide (TPR) repeat protein
MKINLGCGGVYKKGYINVDAFNKTVADKVMSANNLNFEENSCEEIYMSQVIEHLGIVNTIHSLSECYRVLKPDTKLIIETPDIKKTFENYINGDLEARKFSLPWIYGVDIPGMVHRFCFPDDLLEVTLKKIGFISIEKQYFSDDKYQPILKTICKKPTNYKTFQIMSIYRKKLLENKIIDVENQLVSLEIEDFIDIMAEKLVEYNKTKDMNHLNWIIEEGAVRSPTITLLFIETLISQDVIQEDKFSKFIEVLSDLKKVDYPNVLIKIMSKFDNFVGPQEKLFQTISELGKRTFKKLIESQEKKPILDNLYNQSGLNNLKIQLDFFSEKLVLLEAEIFFQIGIKYFVLEKYDKALIMFENAISLNRNHIFSYWNMARVQKMLKKYNDSEKNYKNTLKLVDFVDNKNIEKIRTTLKDEIENKDAKTYDVAITSF